MFWSSLVPIALPISVITGICAYLLFRIDGVDPANSLLAAQIFTGISNAVIGIPKNALAADILSLLFMRPFSCFAALTIVNHALES